MNPFTFFGRFGGKRRPSPARQPELACSICGARAPHLDTVDFNKPCKERNEPFLPESGMPIRYHLCGQCGFCFAPEMYTWSVEEFKERVYNDEYGVVDPDYEFVRPVSNAGMVDQMFGANKHLLRHLDYGGGSGLLSRKMRESGWSSQSYDPFVNPELSVKDLGQFDLVTAFEVFEHVPNVDALMSDLDALCKPHGTILFSTFLSDGYIQAGQPLSWWYASPRNGHISLFSSASLNAALRKKDLELVSFSENLHLALRFLPDWATHIVSER